MRTFFLFIGLISSTIASGQSSVSFKPALQLGESPLVSFSQFETLADSVEHYRENRLVSVQEFVAFSKEKNTVILDTRSKVFFEKKHVKGAVNLPFADFTQENLKALIPNKNTRILIYCNNNFMLELEENTGFMIQDMSFASKEGRPADVVLSERQMIEIFEKEVAPKLPKVYTLALNIPTFINLFGYGYQNVYELHEMVSTSGIGLIEFEGTEVKKNPYGIQQISKKESPLVNYADLQELVDLVKPHREERLISLDQFNQMKLDENTIILDTRSKEMYDAKHVKGAIHLEFSDFTQWTLDELTGGDRNKRVLIYCNNNFITDLEKNQQDRYFMSKIARNPPKFMTELTLALNIPTYINLYGYGFQNVYELNELVVTSDPRIQFEGTSIQ